jgi:hypothetical protein
LYLDTVAEDPYYIAVGIRKYEMSGIIPKWIVRIAHELEDLRLVIYVPIYFCKTDGSYCFCQYSITSFDCICGANLKRVYNANYVDYKIIFDLSHDRSYLSRGEHYYAGYIDYC